MVQNPKEMLWLAAMKTQKTTTTTQVHYLLHFYVHLSLYVSPYDLSWRRRWWEHSLDTRHISRILLRLRDATTITIGTSFATDWLTRSIFHLLLCFSSFGLRRERTRERIRVLLLRLSLWRDATLMFWHLMDDKIPLQFGLFYRNRLCYLISRSIFAAKRATEELGRVRERTWLSGWQWI